ncbi:MAG: exosortase O [Candidatus Methylacidiphilales bacterium]
MLKYKQFINQLPKENLLFGLLCLMYVVYIFQAFQYIYLSITDHFDALFILMLLAVSYWVIQKKKVNFTLFKPIYFYKWNTVAFIFTACLFPFVSYYLRINLFTTVIGLIGFYLLLSFTIPQKIWKNGLIPFTLLLMCLPFGRQLDTYIGFPLRMLSVDFVASQMTLFGFNLNSRNTILIIENKASQVDIDCSGIKGLWVGMIFFIAYTWINKIKLNLKWLGLLFILIISILCFNILRVSTLVMLNSIQGLEKGVQYFHYSIAAFGIVLSCLLVHFLAVIFKLINSNQTEILTQEIAHKETNSKYLFLLNVLILTLLIIPQKPNYKAISKAIPYLKSDENFSIKTINFNSGEKAVFEKDGSAAQKFEFKYKEIIGEAIIVIGNDWRAQHKPELCFEATGNNLQSVQTLLVNKSFPVKYIKFNNQKAVVYSWFQSSQIITDDYSYRNWLELSGKESNWVLMNIVIYNDSNKQQVLQLLEFLSLEISKDFKTNTNKIN